MRKKLKLSLSICLLLLCQVLVKVNAQFGKKKQLSLSNFLNNSIFK